MVQEARDTGQGEHSPHSLLPVVLPLDRPSANRPAGRLVVIRLVLAGFLHRVGYCPHP